MQIGEFAARAGVSPRALRHYEEQGLLAPDRTPAGYRTYSEADLVTVARIRMMIEAGLPTAVIGQYLDCVRAGTENTSGLQICSALRAELDAVAQRLDTQEQQLQRTRSALCELSSPPGGHASAQPLTTIAQCPVITAGSP